MMRGNCQVRSVMPIQAILDGAPHGKTAVFEAISIPSTVCDSVLGSSVYIRNGQMYDYMSDEPVGPGRIDLSFIAYV